MHPLPVIGALALVPTVLASPATLLQKRQNCTFDSKANPSCWQGDFNLDTSYYDKVPVGKLCPYTFNITNMTMAPDGVERSVLAINGQIPGPTIECNWGDTVVITVINSLNDSGTSLHFHGVRQLNSNDQDGTASITQCPTPGDGGKIVYTWNATQYGTSWYHSHYSLQAWDGLFGPIQIHGPASQGYDEDLGPIMLSDWTHQPASSLYDQASRDDGYPMNNGLINGKNAYQNNGNKRHEMIFKNGTSYRLRLINTAMDSLFKVALDGHTMTVIAADFVPIKPFDTDVLSIGIGQRYDIIINATQPPNGTDFWFRANLQTDCGTHETGFDLKAIVRYDATSTADPTTNWTGTDFGTACQDIPMENLVPWLQVDTGGNETVGTQINFEQVNLTDIGRIRWHIKETPFVTQWGYPVLQQVSHNNISNPDPQEQIFQIPQNQWNYVLITNDQGTFHPIHLHGHDFHIVAQKEFDTFNATTFTPQTTNAPRRDVAMLPLGGYLVIAFQSDNPGAWLLHCHIGWHASQGFAATFLERSDEIKDKIDVGRLDQGCSDWQAFAKSKGSVQLDSGI